MIWKSVPLSVTAKQRETLKKHHARLLDHLEEGKPLRVAVLEALKEEMSAVIRDSKPFREVLQQIADSGDHLTVRLEHPDNEILNLPWTLAGDPVSQQPLGSLRQLYLTKTVSGLYDPDLASSGTVILPAPLKVLIMISSPVDSEPDRRLSYEEEELQILQAFEPLMRSGEVEVDFTDDGSLAALERKLKKNRYHVVHFSGHGSYRKGSSFLELEDPLTLKKKPVPAAEFARTINCRPDYRPPLVVISACQTAQGVSEQSIRGATNQLLKVGVPAVISMGLSIDDRYAAFFAASFYGQLAEKQLLPAAFQSALEALRAREYEARVQARDPHPQPLQWIIPNLYLRTPLETPVQWSASREPLQLSSYRYIVEKNRLLLQHEDQFIFIGRRREKARLLEPLFQRTPILLRGQGGVGKTAMAEYLVQRLIAADSRHAPFTITEAVTSLQDILEELKRFLSQNRQFEPLRQVDQLDQALDRFNYLCSEIEKGGRTPVFVFDNLESFQSSPGEAFAPEHQDLAQLIDQLCQQRRYPLILTCRYPLAEFPNLESFDLNQVPLGDFWKRCHYLNLYRLQEYALRHRQELGKSRWLQKSDQTFREVVEGLHRTFGGNYRALEWFDQLFAENPGRLEGVLVEMEQIQALVDEKAAEVVERMRENLNFTLLTDLLEPPARRLLDILARFTLPVQELALTLQPEAAPLAGELPALLEKLHRLTLIEISLDREILRSYYYATPLVKEILGREEADSAAPSFDHRRAGIYHYHIFQNVETSLSELEAAFHHFAEAGETAKISGIGERLAALYYRLALFKNAFYFAQETYERCGEESPPSLLNRLGLILHIYGKYSEALQYYENALKIQQEIGDKAGEGTTLNNISQIYDARGDYETALKYLQDSLKIQQEIGDKAGEGTTLNNISQIYDARGDYETALKYLQDSLKIQQEIGDKAGEGTTLNNISGIYRARGDYETALKYLQDSLKIQQEIGDKAGEGVTLNNISQIFKAWGDYETALKYLQDSLKIQQEIGDKAGEGTTLNNISGIYRARGDYETALKYLQDSLKIQQEIGDKAGEGTTLNNISQIFKARGDYETALKYLQDSLKIRQEIGDKAGEGTTLNNMATTAYARGDYETALKYLQDSLKIRQEIGDKAGEGTTLNNISGIYRARGDYETALKYLQDSLKIQQEIGDKAGEGVTLNNISQIFKAWGDYETALKYLQDSLKIRQEIGDKAGEGTTLNNISQIFKARGDYETALKYLQDSLKIRQEIGDKAGEAYTLFNLAVTYLQEFNQPEKAREYLGRVAKLNSLLQDPRLTKALQDLGMK